MPPSAIPSSVRRVISSSPRRRRNSSTGAGGNLGALPHPPHCGSKLSPSARWASASREPVSGSLDGVKCALERMCSVRLRPDVSTSLRWSRHASATPSSTCLNDGSPCRGSGGK